MISGYVFAILTGIFFGLQGTYSKILTNKVPTILLTWGIFTFTLPFVFFLLVFVGIPDIAWNEFIPAAIVSFVVNLLAWYLFFRALNESTLAHTMPFTAFTPVFLIPVAYLLLGEIPSQSGIGGIILIVAGAYGIHIKSKDVFAPFKRLVKDKGTFFMLIVSFIWGISATVEKVAVLSSSQVFYACIINLMLSLAYLPYLLWNRSQKIKTVRENFKGLVILGLISGLMYIFQFTALKYLLVSYVIGFKRAGIIVSVILGIIIFKEENPLKNLFSTLLMVAGVFLLLL